MPGQFSVAINRSGDVIDVVDQVLERLHPKQAASPYVCKLAFDLDGRVNWNAARKFGIRLWENAQTDPSHLMRLILDSREMLKDASKFVVDADAHTRKYLKLARAIYPTFLKNGDEAHIDAFYLRHYGIEIVPENVNYSTDLTAWRDDADALEVFAFSLMLYAETHIDFFDAQSRNKLSSTISNLCDALDGVKSSYGPYCRAWLKGEKTIVVQSEGLRDKGRFI
jgi:hypothetical protein